jgi:AraC-like DNA-binding protein
MLLSTVNSFSDPYSYQASIRAADVELVVTGRGKFQAKLTRIDLGRIWMQRGYQNLPCIARSADSAERNSILFLAGPDEPAISHNSRELASGEIVFKAQGSTNHLRIAAPCHWGAMSLTPENLAAAGRSLVGRELHAPRNQSIVRPSHDTFSRLQRLHRIAGSLARTAPQSLAHPETTRALESALTHAMISCLTDHLPDEDTFSSRCHSTVMARFQRAIAAEPKKPFYLAELCAITGVPERTLRTCCRESLGMGPMRFLWLRRMHLARRELLQVSPEATSVTAVAMDHGFWQLGRFSVAYRSLFGESPSATLDKHFDVRPILPDSPFEISSAVSE